MFITLSCYILALVITVPCCLIFLECLMAAFGKNRLTLINDQERTAKVAVLIPAHNEEAVIQSTLLSILPQLQPTDTLLVVADNCTDDTAQIANHLGATVIQRSNLQQKGKGYALAEGVRSLSKLNPIPDVVIIIDADCILQENALEMLAKQAITLNKPIQAKYLMESPPNPSIKDLISRFAFLVKNWVRPLGLRELGLSCLLMGTGMAFPWNILKNAPLANDNLVEDMQLGVDLAIAGYAPQFCPEAEVIGQLPQATDNAKKQRTRWEHGHLKTIFTQTPRLLQAAWQQKRFDLLMLALDISIPPLSLLVLGCLGCIFVILIAFIARFISLYPLLMGLMAGFALMTGILIAWGFFARSFLPFWTLFTTPFYILWKLPLYLIFLVKPETKWVKTARDDSSIN
ncbi:MAG: glycosyltransferase family 2 protein [Microcystaceae cyanobacterium]